MELSDAAPTEARDIVNASYSGKVFLEHKKLCLFNAVTLCDFCLDPLKHFLFNPGHAIGS